MTEIGERVKRIPLYFLHAVVADEDYPCRASHFLVVRNNVLTSVVLFTLDPTL